MKAADAAVLSLALALTAQAAPAVAQDQAQDRPPAGDVAPPDPALPDQRPAGEAPGVAPDVVVDPALTLRPDDAAAVPPVPAIWAPVPTTREGRSAYGLYLAGRAALRGGEPDAGADLIGRAGLLTPEQSRVREQGFIAAVMAGDLTTADRVAPDDGSAAPIFAEAMKLVSAVERLVERRPREALAELTAEPVGAPHLRAGRYLTVWTAAAAGDWRTALSPLSSAADAATQAFDALHRAQVLEAGGRRDEAEAAFRTLAETPGQAGRLARPLGEFLERQGRRDEAVAVYDAAIAAVPDDAALVAARARAQAGERPPTAPDFVTGPAEALTSAAQQALGDNSAEFAVIYLRLAQRLRPSDEGRYLLADALTRAGLASAARQALADVGRERSDIYAAAQAQLGLALERDDRSDEALAAFERAAEATPDDPRLARLIAGQLITLERHEAALDVLNGPLLNRADQAGEIRFMRGAAYESLGRVAEAEAELWAALQAQPENPVMLNYLGYLWVDSGARVAEGAEMIARAHAALPEDGNIQDSLGWAQYRQGLYPQAVETLEAAVAKEPANAEINGHLGDAYWRVGREREAGFQWARVLTLDPTTEQRTEAERKLAEGLDASPAPALPAAAGA